MKTMKQMMMRCCQDDKKCEVCQPDWIKMHYIEEDNDIEGPGRYTIFIPLMGFDEQIRKRIKYFSPMVSREGHWYIDHPSALKIYKGTDTYDLIEKRIEDIIKHLEAWSHKLESSPTQEEKEQSWNEMKKVSNEYRDSDNE